MHPRTWVYRRNLSKHPQSLFHSNEDFMQKAGCCISGFLGIVFLALALLCLLTPEVDKDRKLFLIFAGLSAIFEVISLLYSCIPCYSKNYGKSDDEDEYEVSKTSFLSSEENAYEGVLGKDGIAGYQACAGYLEVATFENVPSYQAGPSFPEDSSFLPAPYGLEGSNHPVYACLSPIANCEDVFAHQQIPIYQQNLVESQLPPYSQNHNQRIIIPPNDIHV